MSIVKIQPKGQMTLPTRIGAAVGLADGDLVDVRVAGLKIVITPTLVIDRSKFPTADGEILPSNGASWMPAWHKPNRARTLDRSRMAPRWPLSSRNGSADQRPPNSESAHFITKLVRYNYTPGAACPLFLNFLARIMGNHPDASEPELERAERMLGYLQRGLGYSLTGTT